MEPSISTASGRVFNFLEPEKSDFTLHDIAVALSNICRFTGHTRSFYSVAQHSVMVSYLVPKEYALHGLMHDAAEAFLGDVSTPLKQLLPDYKRIERSVEVEVLGRFGLSAEMPECVKVADLRMLRAEALHFMPKSCMDWPCLQGVEPIEQRLIPMSPSQAKTEFLERYRAITGKNPYL